MAPATIRGVLVALKEAFIVLGMVLGYVCGHTACCRMDEYPVPKKERILIVLFPSFWYRYSVSHHYYYYYYY